MTIMSNSNDNITSIKDRSKRPRSNKVRRHSKTAAVQNSDKTRFDNRKKSVVKDTPERQKINFNPDTTQHQPDVTRYKPAKKSSNPDATRISPKRRGRSTTPQQVGRRNSRSTFQVGQHRILKDRFLLEKVLGVGGMGIVYKAKDRLKVEAKDRDPYVAIKVLSDEFKAHPEAFISLQRETKKSQRIAHPNTVKVYDFDRDGDTVFMTMEYMEGKPLDQLIRQYKSTGLPLDDAWHILKGMCGALIHAHDENIVHSDFKPGNVFITHDGMAKIFDFGIARAVAQVDRKGGKSLDRTVFDSGNLGALTPAYASLEMLQGEKPDVRDDIYALGCVIYELFSGEHPFNKLPADEAYRKKLKPKRIDSISKRQWKALEKTLAFRREDRTESVKDFYKQLIAKHKVSYKYTIAMVAVLSLTIIAYFQFSRPDYTGMSESDIRNEIEFKLRLSHFKEAINRLIEKPTFAVTWEDNLWEEVQGVTELLSMLEDDWLISTREHIFSLYTKKIRKFIKNNHFDRAKTLIGNAGRYTDDSRLLDKERQLLAQALKDDEMRRRALAQSTQQSNLSKKTKDAEEKKRIDSFNLALKNVNRQLKCQSRLNMRDFDIAIKKLRSLDRRRYKKLEGKFVNSLAACIREVGKSFPERAMESKKYAMRIFKSNTKIAAIVIIPRDSCDKSIAGLGIRGNRTLCRDKIRNIGAGPALVVIPSTENIKTFAMGKYEISIADLNKFCKKSTTCSVEEIVDKDLPVTNISISTVKAYLKWLSKKTDRKYRLPTRSEWVYAAKTNKITLDPNRNCQLSTRGIRKGVDFVKTTAGKQNRWGLVNYIGNAQEWVYDKGRRLVAVGGSYKDSMANCKITSLVSHSGNADMITGFRVIRELKLR